MTTLEILDNLISDYDVQILKGTDWKNNPPIKLTQIKGDKFTNSGAALAVKVPSPVVEGDHNF